MASLKPGVVMKLLEDMNNVDLKESNDDRKPVMLQIRSIIPVLEKGDLWPNRGFYLKVSDLTHAIYVSLPQEQNDMIMSNKLKLGQFIYVQKLQESDPAPVLWGITPVAGRRPCEGVPEDILPVNDLMKFLEASDAESVVEKGVISEKKISKSSFDAKELSQGSPDTEVNVKISPKLVVDMSSVNDDSDSDNSTASAISSTRWSKRRSWTASEIAGVKDIFDSSVVKREMKPPTRPRSRSTHSSPVRTTRYDSSDECSGCIRTRRDVSSAKRVVKSSNKSKSSVVEKSCEEISNPIICNDSGDIKEAENRLKWDSLPSNLLKLGKEVVRQRDVALQAAMEALQEACASQRLIRCLSTYSEFQLAEEDELQPFINKFFTLQDDLTRTRLITQSLTNISPVRTQSDFDRISSGTVKEILTLAQERNKNAYSWIKSAIATDLSPLSDSPKSRSTSETLKKSKVANIDSSKPKAPRIVPKQKIDEFQLEWPREGTKMGPGAELAMSLEDECRRWFLNHVEKYLDEVGSKVGLVDSSDRRAAMMYNIKRVSDWVDAVCNTSSTVCKESCTLNECEIETCQRVRNKIYGILMKHVEKTAMGV